jgi:hypothetical protein
MDHTVLWVDPNLQRRIGICDLPYPTIRERAVFLRSIAINTPACVDNLQCVVDVVWGSPQNVLGVLLQIVIIVWAAAHEHAIDPAAANFHCDLSSEETLAVCLSNLM